MIELLVALSKIDADKRELFVDHALLGRTYQQLADDYGISYDLVLHRIGAVRRALVASVPELRPECPVPLVRVRACAGCGCDTDTFTRGCSHCKNRRARNNYVGRRAA